VSQSSLTQQNRASALWGERGALCLPDFRTVVPAGTLCPSSTSLPRNWKQHCSGCSVQGGCFTKCTGAKRIHSCGLERPCLALADAICPSVAHEKIIFGEHRQRLQQTLEPSMGEIYHGTGCPVSERARLEVASCRRLNSRIKGCSIGALEALRPIFHVVCPAIRNANAGCTVIESRVR
jgi:hypothetical protein